MSFLPHLTRPHDFLDVVVDDQIIEARAPRAQLHCHGAGAFHR
jgi:hypothetical protein